MDDLRLARAEDNSALLSLFGDVPMEGQLVLSTQRGPDFFALYELQRGPYETWVADGERGLIGMGSVLVRDGWLSGRPAKVGYLGDLRSKFAARRMRGLARFYGEVLDGARERHGCEVFLTGIIASNAAALNALVKRSGKRANQPRYELFRRFALVSIQFTGERRARRSAFTVRTATQGDLPALTAFLDADHRVRPFGYRFDQGELQHRLARWPGFTLESTYLALDSTGRLVGCTTAWDPSAVKRYRVEAYRGSLRWQKIAFNTAAHLLRWRPLPQAGEEFRTLYLCNTSIQGDSPEIFRALLEHIYVDARPRGYHLLSHPVYEQDPLSAAFDGFITRALDFHLYAVTPASAPRLTLPEGRPGFEPALA